MPLECSLLLPRPPLYAGSSCVERPLILRYTPPDACLQSHISFVALRPLPVEMLNFVLITGIHHYVSSEALGQSIVLPDAASIAQDRGVLDPCSPPFLTDFILLLYIVRCIVRCRPRLAGGAINTEHRAHG